MNHKIIDSRIFKFISSIRLFIFLCIIIVITLVLGTIILQNASPEQYIAKYGEVNYRLLRALKLTNVYHAGWFITLLFLLTFNVFSCALKRFSLKLKRLGSTITHFGIVIILLGAGISAITSERGFIGIREGESKDTFFIGYQPKKLGFRLYLRDFILEQDSEYSQALLQVHIKDKDIVVDFPVELNKEYLIKESGYQVKILRYIPDFSIDINTKKVVSKSSEPNNPAIEVEVVTPAEKGQQWLFAKFPKLKMAKAIDENIELIYIHREASKNIKDFKSKLAVIDDGEIVRTKTIEVNDPLQYRGYTFYQADYNPHDLAWTGIQVAKDPGVPLVYTGFCIFLIGLLFVFYGKPLINKWEGKR